MSKKLVFLFLITKICFFSNVLLSQTIDSTTFKINSRFSFYSSEKTGEFLVHAPTGLTYSTISVEITAGNETIASWKGKPGNKTFRIPFDLKLSPSVYQANAKISVSWRPGLTYIAHTELIVLSYKSNEVKTDNLTGGLIVNKRQFFPFGFYCYSPIPATLPEEEIVNGFNMISPYQKIMPETLDERKAYMDRCAEIGMKVHYNLLSVSGGGGVGSKIEGLSDEEKHDRLLNEIKTFRDHPALLAWYISDEPNGYNIAPEILEDIYRSVKENDPWHPVSMVFMAPFISSRKYAGALDIVMADPYPVPVMPVSLVGNVSGRLKKEFSGKKPVWIAQQSFGGGELWEREPTNQELRSMTWQSIIKGATGIQYFVRQGPNYFPKSTATWSECGKIAMEIAELTPWLLSDERTMPVTSNSKNILVSSRLHDGQLIVMAVNKRNRPQSVDIRIQGINNSKARVLFENRSVRIQSGVITDQLSPFGSQVYLINIKPEKRTTRSSNLNLIKDPGFENLSSPGIPSACYARPGGDRGATYFLDPREHYEGKHSVRIITPRQNQGPALRLYPFKVNAGSSYTISIWAKSDPEQRFHNVTKHDNSRLYKKEMPQYVEMILGDFVRARFIPDNEWRRYVTFFTIPADTLASFKMNLILKMPGQGVAWFDKLKVHEEKSGEQ
jgi:hypothetical protein